MNMMVFGGVKYGHHLGHSTETEWAARYELAKEEGQLKFAKVHIVVVSLQPTHIPRYFTEDGVLGYCCARVIPFSRSSTTSPIISIRKDRVIMYHRSEIIRPLALHHPYLHLLHSGLDQSHFRLW